MVDRKELVDAEIEFRKELNHAPNRYVGSIVQIFIATISFILIALNYIGLATAVFLIAIAFLFSLYWNERVTRIRLKILVDNIIKVNKIIENIVRKEQYEECRK